MTAHRVLVTGANGFVGRHAVDALVDAGHEVVAVSRDPAAAERPGVRTLHADLLDHNGDVDALVAKAGADVLLHLAWETRHGYFWSAPENLDWVAASLRLARAFAAGGGHRLVVAGTCAEYDVPADGRCDAVATPRRPKHLYGVAKDALHRLLAPYATLAGLSFAWGRIFHLVGAGEPATRLLPSVVAALAEGRVFPTGSGARIRDFMDVRDCGRAFARLALADAEGPINVASGVATPIGDLLRLVAAMAGRPDLVGFGLRPEPPGDLPDLYADILPLRDRVGFRPRYGLRDAVKAIIASSRHARAFDTEREAG